MLTLRIQALEGDLFMQTATALLACPHVRILGSQPTLKQPSAILRTELEVTGRQLVAR